MSMFEIVAMIVVVISALWVMALPFLIYLAISQLAQIAESDVLSAALQDNQLWQAKEVEQ